MGAKELKFIHGKDLKSAIDFNRTAKGSQLVRYLDRVKSRSEINVL
jgi:hypothetical protein